ncbi:MAG: hypothetical protein HOB92_07760 [Candidatus Cloacimonetes bacterium]|jgi:predicted  nucleic acid-binding Zn-ribbon protein|nr:hypothetical protein [Candidatus Cloacimonadota bacterium]
MSENKKTIAQDVIDRTNDLDEFFGDSKISESPDFSNKEKMFKWSTDVDKRLDKLEESFNIIDDNLNKLISEIRQLNNKIQKLERKLK